MAVGFMGTLLNQLLKLSFRIPRPWVRDPAFTVVDGAVDAAAGFSFPSGHSTSAVGTFGAIGYVSLHPAVKWVCYGVCVLVPFSRLYLGVHTPWDVVCGAALAVMMIRLLGAIAWHHSEKRIQYVFSSILLLSVCLVLYSAFFPFAIETDQLHNLESGCKNGYTMLGASLGLLIVYPLERKYVNFETKALWWVQILKVILGFCLVLAVKEGLRAPLEALFAGHLIARSVRYCLIVLVAGLLWPMTFRWFSKIGVKK